MYAIVREYGMKNPSPEASGGVVSFSNLYEPVFDPKTFKNFSQYRGSREGLGLPELELKQLVDSRGSDPAARDRLIAGNLPAVSLIALRYKSPMLPYQDIVQEGTIGLIRGIDTFKPERGGNFYAHVARRINGTILEALRDHNGIIRLSRKDYAESRKYLAQEAKLEQQLGGRLPTTAELAAALDISEQEVIELAFFAHRASVISADELDENGFEVYDHVADEVSPSPEHMAIVKDMARIALGVTSGRTAEMVNHVFGLNGYDETSQVDTARRFNVHETRISQKMTDFKFRAKAALEAAGITEAA